MFEIDSFRHLIIWVTRCAISKDYGDQIMLAKVQSGVCPFMEFGGCDFDYCHFYYHIKAKA